MKKDKKPTKVNITKLIRDTMQPTPIKLKTPQELNSIQIISGEILYEHPIILL
jgi:hypothetical protein